MSKFTIPTKIKVLYRPQGIIFIIRGEAEDNKNDPERPILHFYLSWYSKFMNFEAFEMIIIFYLFRPNFTNTGAVGRGQWDVIFRVSAGQFGSFDLFWDNNNSCPHLYTV